MLSTVVSIANMQKLIEDEDWIIILQGFTPGLLNEAPYVEYRGP